MNRFLSLEEIQDIIEDEEFWCDLEDESVDIVEIPPDNVDCHSDCDDIDEDILQDTEPKHISGQFEIHLPEPEPTTPENVESDWKKINIDFPQNSSQHVSDAFESIKQNLKDKTPVQVFEELWSEDIVDLIITQSKLYASQETRQDFELTLYCLRKFIGILLLSGYHSLPYESLYWSEDEDVNVQCVRNCMTKDRFQAIKQNLHFNDNSLLSFKENRERNFKVRPLLDQLNYNFKKFGIFSRELSIDEQMVRYHGHHLKHLIKEKPVRFGFKQWAMCSSLSGYCFHMDLYEGGNEEKFYQDLGSAVVLSLSSHLRYPKEHSLFFDKFFTSYDLMCELNKKNMKATGTVCVHRMNNCPIKSDTVMKKEQGTYDHRFDIKNRLLAMTWCGGKCVRMLTNNIGIEPLEQVKRWSKTERKDVIVDRPFIISEYNKYSGGVEILDSQIQKYRIKFRGKKWYFPIFTNAIDVTLYNAYVLYTIANPPMSLLDFRRSIARTYLNLNYISHQYMSDEPSAMRSTKIAPEVRFDPVGHVLERTFEGKQRKCGHCKRTVRKQCKKCNVGLHLECFADWHNK